MHFFINFLDLKVLVWNERELKEEYSYVSGQVSYEDKLLCRYVPRGDLILPNVHDTELLEAVPHSPKVRSSRIQSEMRRKIEIAKLAKDLVNRKLEPTYT